MSPVEVLWSLLKYTGGRGHTSCLYQIKGAREGEPEWGGHLTAVVRFGEGVEGFTVHITLDCYKDVTIKGPHGSVRTDYRMHGEGICYMSKTGDLPKWQITMLVDHCEKIAEIVWL